MSRYLAAVFSDLEQHSLGWARAPRERMAAALAEYRYVAEALAGQYGSLHRNFTGDGHLFLFENADAAVQFGLKLIDAWRGAQESKPALQDVGLLPVRVGCHFGECLDLEGEAWIGRGINLAKRVEGAAESDSLYATETVLELIDLPLYQFEPCGRHALKGDHLADRALYRFFAFDESALDAKRPEELSAEGWFLKAVALIGTTEENSEDEARSYLEALRLRTAYPEAHNNLAILLKTRGDYIGAAEHYREALRLRPEYPEAHYNYAILLASQDRLAGAEEHLREALRLRPDYVDSHHAYANLLKARGDLVAAEEHYAQSLRLRPDYPEVHNNLAILLEDKGDLEGARYHYREALRLSPGYAEAHYNLAILLENGADVSGAERHYREAIALRDGYGEALNNLAVLLHTRGELEEALEHYRKALRLRPDDPETHYNYALALRASGNSPAADEHLRIARELRPDSPAPQSTTQPPA